MARQRKAFLALALTALVGLSACNARAETISMTITLGNGFSFNIDGLATIDPAGQGYTVSAAGLTTINAILAGQGSEYQFGNGAAINPSTTSLGGSSNFAGNASQANLVLSGEIHSVGAGFGVLPNILTITETESAFTAPTGDKGVLTSSSSGNFTNEFNNTLGHSAFSAFNATPTPTYTVLSNGMVVNSGVTTGPQTANLMPVPTLFTLTNSITFNLSPGTVANNVVDIFGVTSVVTATSIPEPASLVMLLTGMPVPLVIVGWLRRRKTTGA
jgi:hypothetical protein